MESTLVQIIRLYEDFKSEHSEKEGTNNLTSFIAYAQSMVGSSSNYSEEVNTENWKKFSRKTLLEMTAALVGKMGRYIDNYSRKNMRTTPIGSVDEFTYLIPLLEFDSLSKSELIQMNGHAITTGTDIIKRLLKKDFLAEQIDPADKRSKRIKLSESGKMALFQSSETLNKLSVISAGILSNEELLQLVGMLQKLDRFHEDIHKDHKDLQLDDILVSRKEELSV